MELATISFGFYATIFATIGVSYNSTTGSKDTIKLVTLLLEKTTVMDTYQLAYVIGQALRSYGYTPVILNPESRGHVNIQYNMVDRLIAVEDAEGNLIKV